MKTVEKAQNENLKKLSKDCALLLDEKKAKDIVLLNVSEQTPMADYFLIASAVSYLQLKVLSRDIDHFMSKNNVKRVNPKNPFDETTWILSDYGFIVVHLFLEEARGYYNIEKFWHDANIVYKSE